MGFLRIISCTRNVIVVFIVLDTRTMVTIKFSIVVIYTSANRYQSASNSSIKTCAFDGVSYASIKMIGWMDGSMDEWIDGQMDRWRRSRHVKQNNGNRTVFIRHSRHIMRHLSLHS